MKAIQVEKFGGPEVLQLRDVQDPVPTNGLLPVEVDAAGVNYADTHQAENSYHAPAKLPLIPGAEVVGTTSEGERLVALLPPVGGMQRVRWSRRASASRCPMPWRMVRPSP